MIGIILETGNLAMRAMAFDYVVVPLMGVPLNKIAALTFALGSGLAAAAGILYGVAYLVLDPYTGILAAVALESVIGCQLARGIGLSKVPGLFGFTVLLKKPHLIPSIVLYLLIIYILPIAVVLKLGSAWLNRLARKLLNFPIGITVLIHLGLLHASLHWWSEMSLYRVEVLKFTMIAVLVTLSLNVINGYMREFSCSHPGGLSGHYFPGVHVYRQILN